MWRVGPHSLPRCSKLGCAFWKGWMRSVRPVFAAVLLLTAQGCSLPSSTPAEIPPLPVLSSLQSMDRNGRAGVWMSSDDAGRLALWIYGVTGENGR